MPRTVIVTLAFLVAASCAPPHRYAEIFIPSDPFSISGTLYLPADTGRHPAVILIHGSRLVLGG